MLINPMEIKQKNQILIDANTPSLLKIKKNNRIKNKRLRQEIMKGNKIQKKLNFINNRKIRKHVVHQKKRKYKKI